MRSARQNIGKILYSIVFLLIIPAGLWLWAQNTEYLTLSPIIQSQAFGWSLIICGGILMSWGMIVLIILGKGLPMNAYPPIRFVRKGPYRISRHPIYWGFGILMVGFFVLIGSPSGLWLVTPLTILSMIALVWGYERIDLRLRFPDETIRTGLDLPENSTKTADLRDRFASLFWVVALLILGNFLVKELSDDIALSFGDSFELHPIIENPYLTFISFAFILSTPFFLNRKDILRNWVLCSLIALSLSTYISLLFSTIGSHYLLPEGLLPQGTPGGDILLITVPIFLILLSLQSIFTQSRQLFIFFSLLAIILIIIQLANSRSASIHFVSSLLIFLLAIGYRRIWNFLRITTEKVANSWKEWVFGKIRVINHGFHVGIGAFGGILLAGILAGEGYAWAILVFAIVVIVFSALWAQIIEGSEKLKRPFGYYGALVGVIFASLAVWAMGFNVWVIIGVISVVMPWVQAVGRLRCLVNGCCHGARIDDPALGIRYSHHRSRVCGISGLKGQLLHPTPLYAIIWLFFIGFILLALWNHNFPSPFIFGLYLILNGIGRFVEEAYRGEVQTPIVKGLRLYQWTAIMSVIIGIVMTLINVEPVVLTSDSSWKIVLAAFIGGLFTTFAMGVDFPYSNARFSRLV